jgi:ectoine hydroxylase-related dioxygenase (phytanoyl-CoA dioxygenase family)
VPPVQFGTQGILYLSDTAENQGAFTLVPSFNNRIDDWLKNLPTEVDPRLEDLYALGPKPIAANAGDFIIWHHILPHGSSPNTAALPRFVQYINYSPVDENSSESW